MRNLYLLFVLFLFSMNAQAQVRLTPIHHNPILEGESQKEIEKLKAEASILRGEDLFNESANRSTCPTPESGVTYLFGGDTVYFFIDTLGLTGPGASLTCIDCDEVEFGSASLDGTTLTYSGGMNVDAGRDSVNIEFCLSADDCVIFTYVLVVKRIGSVSIENPVVIASETSDVFCFDSGGLPGTFTCGVIIDCPDNYDGEGQQFIDFTMPGTADECIFYQASSFPGVDTVCVVLCDDFTVCDTFKLPIEITGDTISVPLFEDFSRGGPYPNRSLWLDKNVYVNQTIGKNPPSIGYATFDGLDQTGAPYGGAEGYADYLSSKPIDLSSLSPADSVVLSFYAQKKGLGFLPRTQDSLVLQFKDEFGNWTNVLQIPGSNFIPNTTIPPFEFFPVRLKNPAYFFKGFQFRFTNINPRTGAYSNWHVDYILLNQGRQGDDANLQEYNDITFSEPPNYSINTYTAMPVNQFMASVQTHLSKEISATLYNSNFQAKAIPDSRIILSNKETETVYAEQTVSNATTVSPFDYHYAEDEFDQSELNTAISRINTEIGPTVPSVLNLTYALNLSNEDFGAEFNDTTSRQTVLDNYFAYDDGTAERAIEANGLGAQIAVKFHADVADNLQGVMIHFPHVNGNVEDQIFNLHVYIDDLENPTEHYEVDFNQPIYANSYFDTLQGFTTYRTLTLDSLPIPIPADSDFYIAWEQGTFTTTPMSVGYDLNNPEGVDFVYYNTGIQWEALADVGILDGAVMLRPVLGDEPVQVTSTKNQVLENDFVRLFPNPSSDVLNIDLKAGQKSDYQFELFNQLGQRFEVEMVNSRINVQSMQEGIYFLKITDLTSRNSQIEKIMVLK